MIIDPDTKTEIKGHSYRSLRGTWNTHRKDNGLATEQVDDWINEQVCAKYPTFCAEKGESRVLTPGSRIPLHKLITGAASELAKWAAGGFKVATPEVVAQRAKTCSECPQWDKYAYSGLGRCKACGCSGAKQMLATSKCPESRWAN